VPDLSEDTRLVERLRAGDEEAFAELVERYQASMLRLAQMYVSTRAVAEEVVQEAWLGVLKGPGGFEGRSSLRTWIFRIVVNTAKTRGQRESRSVPFSSAFAAAENEPAVDPDRFLPPGGPSRALGLGADLVGEHPRRKAPRERDPRSRRASHRGPSARTGGCDPSP
jgi:RNA polymerase sigma factor (sigma-70 family)